MEIRFSFYNNYIMEKKGIRWKGKKKYINGNVKDQTEKTRCPHYKDMKPRLFYSNLNLYCEMGFFSSSTSFFFFIASTLQMEYKNIFHLLIKRKICSLDGNSILKQQRKEKKELHLMHTTPYILHTLYSNKMEQMSRFNFYIFINVTFSQRLYSSGNQ